MIVSRPFAYAFLGLMALPVVVPALSTGGKIAVTGLGIVLGGAPTYENYVNTKASGHRPGLVAPHALPLKDNPHGEFDSSPLRAGDFMVRQITPSNILPTPKLFQEGDRWILNIPRS